MSRVWQMFAALSVLAPIVAADAQIPAVSPALLPGEVLLQVSATGEDRRPTDDVTAKLAVRATGASAAEARSVLDAKVSDVIAFLAKAGIDRRSVSIGTPSGVTPLVMRAIQAPSGTPAQQKATSTETLTLKLTGAVQLQSAKALVDGEGVMLSGTPSLALKDNRAARQAATADGFAKAKEAAQVQASLLGMRIVRPIRASNYGPLGDMDILTQPIFQAIHNGLSDDDMVTTTSRVYLDFAVAPKP